MGGKNKLKITGHRKQKQVQQQRLGIYHVL